MRGASSERIVEQISESTVEPTLPPNALQDCVTRMIAAWHDDEAIAPFAAAMAAVVAPLGDGAPAGVSLRYHPIFREINVARASDDPSLPQGEWVRALKKADWGKVVTLCQRALGETGKDYQVAAWLCEGWFHTSGVPGLQAGIATMTALVSRYWRDAFPTISRDDCDARFNVFDWLDEEMARLLRSELTLRPAMTFSVDFKDDTGGAESDMARELTAQRWQQVTAGEGGAGMPDAATWRAKTDADGVDALHRLRATLTALGKHWQALRAALDVCVAAHAPADASMQAPALRQGERAIEAVCLAISGILDGRHASWEMMHAEGIDETVRAEMAAGLSMEAESGGVAADIAGLHASTEPVASMRTTRSEWTRAGAYRMLAEIAAFLRRQEPHSPVPYLIEKAVRWENEPLDEIMSEVLRDDISTRQYAALLGISLEG